MSADPKDLAKKIVQEHTPTGFCCYADRAPCTAKELCGKRTCSKCCPTPYDGRGKPVWPCSTVALAHAVLGTEP